MTPEEYVQEEIKRRDADPKRTGVKASMIQYTEPPIYYDGNRLCGPPGAFINRMEQNLSHWILCCPGCGEAGSPRDGHAWTATQGSFDDVSTLTLSPSIAKSCCGWHGYLRNGVFESC
jgi:hypothetical protein